MKELLNALKPLRLKIMTERCLNSFVMGLICGLAADCILLIISKFTLIFNLIGLLFFMPACCLMISFFAAVIKGPSHMYIAAMGDSLGYKERFTTAMEAYRNNNKSGAAGYVLRDAVVKASSVNLGKLYKINIKKRNITVMILAAMATVLVGFIPEYSDEKIKTQAAVRQKIEDEIKLIDKTAEGIDNKEIKEQIKELKKQLRNAKTEGEAVKAIHQAEQQLKKISKNSVNKDLVRIGERLAENEFTKQMGENLKNENYAQIAKDMEKLRNMIQNMSEEQLAELADIYKKLAEEIVSDEELKDTINDLGEALGSGEFPQIDENLSKLSDTIADLSLENKEIRDAVEQLNESLKSSGNKLDGEGQNKQSGGEGKSPEQNGSGKENAEGEENGISGGAAGEQAQGNNGGQAQGDGGDGRGKGHIENEKIYSRKAQEYADYEAKVEGVETENGDVFEIRQKGVGQTGQSVPYDRVYDSYKQEALTALEENNIPYGLKDIVKEYFSSL